MSLERFHRAQESARSGYATALTEMRQGRKTSHWIWYVFPQIDGLGRSGTAQEYSLGGVAEAEEYLRDPVLGGRYLEIAQAVENQLARGVPLERLMSDQTDALKLVSSLTLFRAAADVASKTGPDPVPLIPLLHALLDHTAAQGYPPCAFTLERLSSNGGR